MSHGYLACGILPVRLALPVLTMSLLGPSVEIPDDILMESFVDYMVFYEANIFRESVSAAKNRLELPPALLTKLTNLLSRFGCHELPESRNVVNLIIQIARHEFAVKPVGAILSMHSGVPCSAASLVLEAIC